MNKKYIVVLVLPIVLMFIFIGINNFQASNLLSKELMNLEVQYPDNANIKEIDLEITNDDSSFYINGEKVADEIRISNNTLLKVNVINNSDFNTSMHFHGIRGLNKMDGVGGVTQGDIKPNKTFEYEFYLDDPGTYMYHSHVDSENQINNEFLYGALIVEDEQKQELNNKYSLMYNMPNDYEYNVSVNGEEEMTYNYDSGDIYLNIVNISSKPIIIDFGKDIEYQITNVDANDVQSEKIVNKSLYLPVANRIEVKITKPNSNFVIQATGDQIKSTKVYMNLNNQLGNEEQELNSDIVYLYDVINMNDSLNLSDKEIDKSFSLELAMTHPGWSINNKFYPDTDELLVSSGDIVEVDLYAPVSMHSDTHPFHLHGHEFKLVSINDNSLEKNIVLDTLEIIPGNHYKIRFEANNPGVWAFHCHDLVHSGAGMMTTVKYEDYI